MYKTIRSRARLADRSPWRRQLPHPARRRRSRATPATTCTRYSTRAAWAHRRPARPLAPRHSEHPPASIPRIEHRPNHARPITPHRLACRFTARWATLT